MRQLIEKFNDENVNAQALIDRAKETLAQCVAPSDELCEGITASLTALQAIYQDIRRKATVILCEDEMPSDNSSVHAYLTAVEKSIHLRKKTTIAILETFLRTSATEMRYIDALENSREQAKRLLEVLSTDSLGLPDVTTWDAFNRGVCCNDFDTDEGSDILDIVSDHFPPLTLRGLMLRKYFLATNDQPAAIDEVSEDDKRLELDTPKVSTEESIDTSTEREARAEVERDEQNTDTGEPNCLATNDFVPENHESNETTEELPQEEYISPRTALNNMGVPSWQKLRDIIYPHSPIWYYIVKNTDKFVLFSESAIVDAVSAVFTKENCISSLRKLEEKGYLAAYVYNDEVWYCATEQLRNCLAKSKLKNKLNDLLKTKNLGLPAFVALQNVPLSLFSEYTTIMNVFYGFAEKYDQMPAVRKKLGKLKWHEIQKCLSFELRLDEQERKTLQLVSKDSLGVREHMYFDGLLFDAEELPDAAQMGEADVYYCLTNDALYVWNGEVWIAIVEPTKDPQKAAAPSIAEDVQQDITPDVISDATSETAFDAVSVESDTTPVASEFDLLATTDGAAMQDHESEEIVEASSEINSEEEMLDDVALELPMVQVETSGSTAASSAPKELEKTKIDENASAAEICALLLSRDCNPAEEELISLIEKLLASESVNDVIGGSYTELAQAIVLAKSAAVDNQYASVNDLYQKILLATFIKLDPCNYSGENLTTLFSDAASDEQALMLSAYCLAMLMPAQAYDYTLRNATARLCAEYDDVFPSYPGLKQLFHSLNEVADVMPGGFSDSVLDMLSGHEKEMAYLKKINDAAAALLCEPNIKSKMHGLPELRKRCFGLRSDLYAALEIASGDNFQDRQLVEEVLSPFCPANDPTLSISTDIIESTIDHAWRFATMGLSTSGLTLGLSARRQVFNAFYERLSVLKQWVDYNSPVDEAQLPEVKRLSNKLLCDVAEAKASIASVSSTELPAVVALMLCVIERKLSGSSELQWFFADFLNTGIIPMDDSQMPIIDPTFTSIRFYEPWRLALEHIVAPRKSLTEVAECILLGRSQLGDNLHQLKLIGAYLHADTEEYTVNDQQMQEAVLAADDKFETFKNTLELAYTYNRIEENEKETMLAAITGRRHIFYDYGDFACWAHFIEAFEKQINLITAERKKKLRIDLEACFATLDVSQESDVLLAAQRLLEEDENFAVAEDYINRFRNGETKLSEELAAALHDPDSFAAFTSDEVFEPLYNECANHSGQALSKFGSDYIVKYHSPDWTERHKEAGKRLLSKWPTRLGNSTPAQIKDLFTEFGLTVTNVEQVPRHDYAIFKLDISRTQRDRSDYVHPIAAFGTQAASHLYVVILFGRRMAQEMVDTITSLNLGSLSIVLNDRALDRADRRLVAELFFTRTSRQNSFLLIDQVLALYLALQQPTERLPVLLKCTLPYTSYQPFVRDGGPTSDEMFCGRVSELATITDPNGACVVYGGRQLGKTALLQRAECISIKPEQKHYAAYCSVHKLTSETAVVQKIMDDIMARPHIEDLKLQRCSTIKELCQQFQALLSTNVIERMLLLIDEVDDFLRAIRDNKYRELNPLVELKRSTGNRFKFVIAGLHNVCRAKNATEKNGMFGQLGHPLCIKPLSPTDALQLISWPLRYLGFQVDCIPHLETILTNTNYYPGILQFFGYTLIQSLASQYGRYYHANTGNPPFTLQKDQLGAIMSSTDLNTSIKEKFKLSLELDTRYFMLARCIATLYYDNQDDPNAEQLGFSVAEIMDQAKGLGINCLVKESQAGYTALMDEMVDMGILSCPSITDKRYRLRRRSFLNIIGADIDTLLNDIIENNEEVDA